MSRLHTTFIALVAASLVGCSSTPHRPTALPSQAHAAPVAQLPPPPPVLDPETILLARLEQLAPDADPGVLALALQARQCAIDAGQVSPQVRLAVIDYSRPSTQKRLWVFDVDQGRLLHHEHVAHGSGSGDNMATRFSNQNGSHATSLGLFRTAETYMGGNGYSLRLDGLDPGFNDAARPRAVVMHGAWYVNPDLIRSQGRLGRSQGCPALRQGIARQVIDDLKGEQLLFSYADNAEFLRDARSFACGGKSARQIIADARRLPAGHRVTATAAP